MLPACTYFPCTCDPLAPDIPFRPIANIGYSLSCLLCSMQGWKHECGRQSWTKSYKLPCVRGCTLSCHAPRHLCAVCIHPCAPRAPCYLNHHTTSITTNACGITGANIPHLHHDGVAAHCPGQCLAGREWGWQGPGQPPAPVTTPEPTGG